MLFLNKLIQSLTQSHFYCLRSSCGLVVINVLDSHSVDPSLILVVTV